MAFMFCKIRPNLGKSGFKEQQELTGVTVHGLYDKVLML